MSLSVVFNGQLIYQGGVYSKTNVQNTSSANPQLGIMCIIGEAAQGDPFADETSIDDVSWGPSQYGQIQAKYGSGPLVDAALQAFNASNDDDIKGGAQKIITLKTNASAPAALSVPGSSSAYGQWQALRAGLPGNNLTGSISSLSGQVVFTVVDQSTGQSEVSPAIGGVAALSIQAAGSGVTAAALTVTGTTLSTAITGGSTANLSVPLKQFATIAQLAQYINSQPGYTATVGANQGAFPPSIMDQCSAQSIFSAPFAVLRDAYDVQSYFAQSALVSFIPAATSGLPIALAQTYFTGGALGGTSMSNVMAALTKLQGADCDFVVPLFSQDATADIAAGLTDASSTYAIAAINAAALSHCNLMSTTKGKNERQAVLSIQSTYANAKLAASALNAARAKMFFQGIDALNSSDDIVPTQPWMLAVTDAAMKCAAVVGLSNFMKQPNIDGFFAPENDFDPAVQGDDAIQAGLCFVRKGTNGGFEFAIDNSTYQSQTNAWYYARPSVIYAGDIAAQALRLNLEIFLGKRNSDISEETIKNMLVKVLDILRDQGIIVGDLNTGGKGYKDLSVQIVGNIVTLNVTLVLVENIEWELLTINVQRANL